jgi:orotidine-5'-phosphate decarboxylase
MNYQQLVNQVKTKQSFLCVGLDTDITKIPEHLKKYDDPVFQFNREIIDATHDISVAYKPNIAFYECYGEQGWRSLKRTVDYIRKQYPDIFLIADAKRGDIGNTSKMYAKTFFETYDFDAVTVSPYMGSDSIKPFLEYDSKWVIILSVTSNSGADDFQKLKLSDSKSLYIKVIETCAEWGSINNMMFVVGATQTEMLAQVRKIVPKHFLLIPGVGAQGGDLSEVAKFGFTSDCGLLVNSSRNILYASNGNDFANKARKSALETRNEMNSVTQLIAIYNSNI